MKIKPKVESEQVENEDDYDEYDFSPSKDEDDDMESEMEEEEEEETQPKKPTRRKPIMAPKKTENAPAKKFQLVYQEEQAGFANAETNEMIPVDLDKPHLAILAILADLSNKIDVIGESVNG